VNRTLPASLVALVATATILLGAPSALAAGPATHLQFSQQPTDVSTDDVITPPVTVLVLDAAESPVAGVDVALALSGGTSGAALGGTTTQTSVSDGTATFADLTVDKVGTGYLLTASATGVTSLASDPFAVTAGAVDSIVLSPDTATIKAGDSQAYTAEGFDAHGNDLGDVTANTTFTIESGSGASSCPSATCSPTKPGDWTVTGDDGGVTDTATLHVTVGDLASITISPASATIVLGASQSYTAEGFDSEGNSLGDVTSDTTFTIEPGSGASTCPGATCSPTVAGDWTVTGQDGAFSDTAVLHVIEGDVVTLQVTPVGGGTITAGGSKEYQAEGFNSEGHSLGDVTADTHFSIESGAGGSCTGAVCTATVAGDWTVTGTYTGGAPSDTSTLHVDPAAAAKLAFGDQPVNTPAGTRLPNVTVEVQDAFGNLVTDAQPGNKIGLTIARNPSGGHLSGGTPRSIVDGVALFHNLVVDKPGTGYTLRAKAEVGFTQPISVAFNIQGPTDVTTSVNTHLIGLNQPVRLVAHLAHCLDRCVLTLYRDPAGADVSMIGTPDRPVNGQGNVAITLTPEVNTSYYAVFTGDSRYLRKVSNHSQVDVHVSVGSGLHGYFSTSKNGYRLFHYHSSCPGKDHKGCPVTEGWVTPNKATKRLWFTLQAFSGGRWQTIASTHNLMHSEGTRSSASIIWIYGGPSVKNIPLRTRAYFTGDSLNAGARSIWRYFKVV
jgi:hypothetical protein